jgi:hypothetical protein
MNRSPPWRTPTAYLQIKALCASHIKQPLIRYGVSSFAASSSGPRLSAMARSRVIRPGDWGLGLRHGCMIGGTGERPALVTAGIFRKGRRY